MLDVFFEPHQLLLNVAAIHQQRRFLQNAFRFNLRPDNSCRRVFSRSA